MDKYKKTSINFSKDVETRKLRALRRSVDRSYTKHIRLSALRHIDPFDENLEDSIISTTETEKDKKDTSLKNKIAEKPCSGKPLSRLEMLKKWKEEKELKKKLAKQQSKPAFVHSKAPSSGILPKVFSKIKAAVSSSSLRKQIPPPKSVTKQNQPASNLPRINSSAQAKRDVQAVQRNIPQVKGAFQPAQRNVPQVKGALPQKNSSFLPQKNASNVPGVPKVNYSKGGSNMASSSKFTPAARNNVTSSTLKTVPQTKGCPVNSTKKAPLAKDENKQNGAKSFLPGSSNNVTSSKLATARSIVTPSSSDIVSQSKGCPPTASMKMPQAKDADNKSNKQTGSKSFAPSNFKFKPPLSLQEIFFKSCHPSKPVSNFEKSFKFTPAKLSGRNKATPNVSSSKKNVGIGNKLTSVSIPPKPVFEDEKEVPKQQNSKTTSVQDKDESSTPPLALSPAFCKGEKFSNEPASVEPEETETKTSETESDVTDHQQNKTLPVMPELVTTKVLDDVSTEEQLKSVAEVCDIPLSEINALPSPSVSYTPRRSRRLASLHKQMEHLVLTPDNSEASECVENQIPVECTKSDDPLISLDTDACIIKKVSEEKIDNKKERKSLRPRQSTVCKPNMAPIIEGIEALADNQPKNSPLDTPKPLTRQQRKISLLGSPQIPCHGSRKSVKGDLITFSPII